MCVHFCLLATSTTPLESVELQLPCPIRTSLRLWTNSNLVLVSMDSTTLAEVSESQVPVKFLKMCGRQRRETLLMPLVRERR